MGKDITGSKELHLNSLMCLTRNRFSDLVKNIEGLGYEVIITSSYRSAAKQKELYEKLKNKKNGRAAKKSKHEYGIAFDINLKKGKEYWKKSTSKSKWEATGVPKLANRLGFRWGGDFANNYDPVHFDLSDDFTTNKLTDELENLTEIPMNRIFYCKVETFYQQYFKDWIE